MPKITILYSFPLRLGVTGIGMTAWYQIVGLLKSDLNVRLFCGSCEKPVKLLDYKKELFRYGPFKLPMRLFGSNVYNIHDKVVAKFLQRDRGKIDIVHCWPSAALETLKTARKLGIKTVLERPSAHTRYVFEIVDKECKRLGMLLNKSHYAAFNHQRLEREEAEFEMADKLLCPSEFVVKTFLDQGFDAAKLCYTQYGYDPSLFASGCQEDSQSCDSHFRMIYVGNCSPLKGLHFALQAWLESEASRSGTFLICGSMIPSYYKVIKKWLDHPSVEYIGFVNNVSELMRSCHALVLPSLAEGSALVTYEARACGCILLVSDAAGAICGHMQEGLIHKAGDVQILRDHINLLSSDIDFRKKLHTNSIAGLSGLTWTVAAQKLKEIYLMCMES